MKKILPVLLIFLITTGTGLSKSKTFPQEKPKAWCESVCMTEMFKNFHKRGESWGTSSSSLNGVGQANIFDTVLNYCAKIYSNGCFKVEYENPSAIHTKHGTYYSASEK